MQFARENPSVTVVGLGAGSAVNGDSVDGAREFVSRYGADTAGMTMIYDVSFQSWRPFGVFTQPWMVLINGNGEVIFNQAGRVDLENAPAALGL